MLRCVAINEIIVCIGLYTDLAPLTSMFCLSKYSPETIPTTLRKCSVMLWYDIGTICKHNIEVSILRLGLSVPYRHILYCDVSSNDLSLSPRLY